MLGSLVFVAGLSSWTERAAAVEVEALAERQVIEQPGILSFPVTATTKDGAAAAAADLSKRQSTVVALDGQNAGAFYTIDLVLGTPGQKVTVAFDTGSAELWVNPNCSKSYDPKLCSKFGRFTQSKTLGSSFVHNQIKYGTGVVDLEYVYDYVQMGSIRLKQQIFGVALDSNYTATGILGAGPMGNSWNSSYPLVIDSLVQQGFINSRAFSLDLRNVGDSRGSVTFGGIDTKKFSGPLEKRPIIPAKNAPDKAVRYWVSLDGMSVSNGTTNLTPIFEKAGGIPVFIDSGGTLCQLPTVIIKELLKYFPSAKKNGKVYTIDCPAGDSKLLVNFKFGNTLVRVSMNDFIWRQGKFCILGAYENDNHSILGDTFLRAAYVVYDQDNANIYIANNQDCGSNLIPIGKGPNAVPSTTGDCSGTTTSPAASSTQTSTSASFIPISAASSSLQISTSPSTLQSSTSPRTLQISTAPSSISSSTATPLWSNHTSSSVAFSGRNYTAPPTVTSTMKTTQTYTITSCASTATNCPIGKVTTEVRTSYSTYRPVSSQASQSEKPTKTQYREITATFTLPYKHTCIQGVMACPNADGFRTPLSIVTVQPVTVQGIILVPGAYTWTSPPRPSPSTSRTTPATPVVSSAPSKAAGISVAKADTTAQRTPSVAGTACKGISVSGGAVFAVIAAAAALW